MLLSTAGEPGLMAPQLRSTVPDAICRSRTFLACVCETMGLPAKAKLLSNSFWETLPLPVVRTIAGALANAVLFAEAMKSLPGNDPSSRL